MFRTRRAVFYPLSRKPAWLAALAACCGLLSSAQAQPSPSLSLTRVATGLSGSLYATHAPGDPDNLYIVQRTGIIRILDLTSNTLKPTPFLTREQLLATTGSFTSSSSEQGLLGLAFHPDYATNGRYYVNYTNSSGQTRVRSFQRSASDPYVTDVSIWTDILLINQPYTNHNGGWIGFGPDGYLYIGTGDGGSGNDPGNNGQNRNSLLGKMLRIAPSTTSTSGYTIPADNPWVGQTGVRQEVWAYGLRNPWRNSFDRLTGDLYMGDVGQGAREEISFQPAGSTGGENYGWRFREGTIATPGIGGTPPAGMINPIYDYLRSSGPFRGICVTGGYVYRGPIQGIRGHYFFGDYGSGRLFSLKFDGSSPSSFNGANHTSLIDWVGTVQLNVGTLGNISSFGEDAQGNLYLINLNGNVYKFTSGLIPAPTSVAASRAYHGDWTGSGIPQWDGLDTSKVPASPGATPTTLGLENIVNGSAGINGVALDVYGLYDLNDAQWEFSVSPQGTFDQGTHPISSWDAAPAPKSITLHDWIGQDDSHRVLVEWADNEIENRWLRIRLTVGGFSQEFYLGHLLGETTGPNPNGVYTVSFEDIAAIRTAAGNSVDAGSDLDIDKNGIVNFYDISLMRPGVGEQLTNITLP